MLRVLSCIATEHDLRMVLLAAAVCVLGSMVSVRLFARARQSTGALRGQWIFLSGVAFGSTIWSTHFIAMLAYAPGLPTGYDLAGTILSLFVAIIGSAGAFTLASQGSIRGSAVMGGALSGLAIGSMHFTGMSALMTQGVIVWDQTLVAASLVIGVVLGALALRHAVRPASRLRDPIAAGLLVVAICGLHFTAMGAVEIRPDPAIAVPDQAIPYHLLAAAVAGVTFLLIAVGFSTSLIDSEMRAAARQRFRMLADATVEGIVICEGERIVDVNKSFEAMAATPREELNGRSLGELVAGFDAGASGAIESELLRPDGGKLPVELLSKPGASDSTRRIHAIRDLTERRAAQRRIEQLAHFDALTGLPNRAVFLDRLASDISAARTGELALVAIDLDRFKEVNDVFGHAVGDRVLMETAARMKAVLDKDEFLARLGGDEFVALQRARRQPEGVNGLTERLLAAIAAPVSIEGSEIHIGASMGVALHPSDGETTEALMSAADLAMYRAKETVGNAVCYFERGMDEKVRERRTLALEMREGFERGEFALVYQAQSDLTRGEIIGYEALLRWQHPGRGAISPGEFIPIAEETGLIIPIGAWVLREACRAAAAWPRPYRVAVNVSPVQFTQGDLPHLVHSVLLETGLPAARLELEITESMLIGDMARALHVLRQLKALGVAIAMDDFGTGYSSLSTLQAFPFDKIKIDRSFVAKVVSNEQASSIVRAILALGKSLSVPILAEGIETESHLAFLAREGCTEGQGYLIGRPAPPEALPELGAAPAPAQAAAPAATSDRPRFTAPASLARALAAEVKENAA